MTPWQRPMKATKLSRPESCSKPINVGWLDWIASVNFKQFCFSALSWPSKWKYWCSHHNWFASLESTSHLEMYVQKRGIGVLHPMCLQEPCLLLTQHHSVALSTTLRRTYCWDGTSHRWISSSEDSRGSQVGNSGWQEKHQTQSKCLQGP